MTAQETAKQIFQKWYDNSDFTMTIKQIDADKLIEAITEVISQGPVPIPEEPEELDTVRRVYAVKSDRDLVVGPAMEFTTGTIKGVLDYIDKLKGAQ